MGKLDQGLFFILWAHSADKTFVRKRKFKLTLTLLRFLFVGASSWLLAPVFIIYDFLSALNHPKRRNLVFNYFLAWLLICGATVFTYWKGHKVALVAEMDFLVFFTAPASWYLFRLLINYQAPFTGAKELYKSKRWKHLRYLTFKKFGRTCMLCGANEGPMHIDHIKPRSKYPHLAYDASNLQVLCADCNRAKSNIYEDDFRKKAN